MKEKKKKASIVASRTMKHTELMHWLPNVCMCVCVCNAQNVQVYRKIIKK